MSTNEDRMENIKVPKRGKAGDQSTIKKMIAPIVLFVFGLAIFVIGLVVQPHRSTIKPIPASTLTVTSKYQLKSIAIQLLNLSDGFFATVSVKTVDSRAESVKVEWDFRDLPTSQAHPDLGKGYSVGFRTTYNSDDGIGGDDVAGVLADDRTSIAVIRLDTSQEFLDDNGISYEELLPSVILRSEVKAPPDVTVEGQDASSAGFVWNSDSLPMVASFGSTWNLSASPTQPTYYLGRILNATNPTNVADDQNRFIIAGVAYGVAGGAFVGALQESLHVSWRRKRSSKAQK